MGIDRTSLAIEVPSVGLPVITVLLAVPAGMSPPIIVGPVFAMIYFLLFSI
jgi:hypothetical protein